NIATLVSTSYEEVIIFLHEQYKDVKETRNMLLAIENKQQQATCIDFSRNDNPAYWCKKLPNKRVSPRGVQVSRHERRGTVEAAKPADSQRVDRIRQEYGGYTQSANQLNIEYRLYVRWQSTSIKNLMHTASFPTLQGIL
ncbi:MAG: hypothetical protein ACKPKO_30375, partial [Candidatus Fonsibacter sp.]